MRKLRLITYLGPLKVKKLNKLLTGQMEMEGSNTKLFFNLAFDMGKVCCIEKSFELPSNSPASQNKK